MRIALYQPDIAQNTGTILRLAACFGVAVDVIAPTGFDMTDRALRRAGLDYLEHVELERHESFGSFHAHSRRGDGRLVLLSAHATTALPDFSFKPSDILLLGRESAGVPAHVRDRTDAAVRIPIRAGLRSLNVAVATAIAVGEALRQTNAYPR